MGKTTTLLNIFGILYTVVDSIVYLDSIVYIIILLVEGRVSGQTKQNKPAHVKMNLALLCSHHMFCMGRREPNQGQTGGKCTHGYTDHRHRINLKRDCINLTRVHVCLSTYQRDPYQPNKGARVPINLAKGPCQPSMTYVWSPRVTRWGWLASRSPFLICSFTLGGCTWEGRRFSVLPCKEKPRTDCNEYDAVYAV